MGKTLSIVLLSIVVIVLCIIVFVVGGEQRSENAYDNVHEMNSTAPHLNNMSKNDFDKLVRNRGISVDEK